MEELERACLILARTPGLTAGRLLALLPRPGCDAVEALECLRRAGGRVSAGVLGEGSRGGLFSGGGLPGVDLGGSGFSEPDGYLIDADRRWIAANRCQLIACTSSQYPAPLLQRRDAPPVLFVQGRTELLTGPQLAMVGARAASPGGRATAQGFASRLAAGGMIITSGLASGIDAASHEGALSVGGPTLAVCAHGLDLCYPRENAALATRIRESGALVSAWPPGTRPRRHFFLQRNVLIAALCRALLVVEATSISGSLRTARCARSLGREVFAVPGCIRDPLAQGCHELIREGAGLVHSVEQLVADLKISFSDQDVNLISGTVTRPARPGPPLDKELEMLLDAAGFEPVGIDVLADRTGLTAAAVASMLLMLELQGRIALQPGGRYCRLS